MITGLIHFVIEGWVVIKADFYKDASGSYLSDTCAHCRPIKGCVRCMLLFIPMI